MNHLTSADRPDVAVGELASDGYGFRADAFVLADARRGAHRARPSQRSGGGFCRCQPGLGKILLDPVADLPDDSNSVFMTLTDRSGPFF